MKRKKPEKLAFYEVMMRRAPNAGDYTKLYAQVHAGYHGERRLDREWKDAGANGLLLHDFTCFNTIGHPHQIDTIFICKHFVLVVEVKNIAGRIRFNEDTRQLIRIREDGRVEAFTNPIDQVKRHRQLLENHFLMFPDIVPVEAAVIITNPYCVIEHISDDVPIFIVNGLRSKLMEMIARHQHVNLNMRAVQASLEQLYRPHTTQPWRKIDSIKTGVLCLQCNQKMVASNKGFKCTYCNIIDSKHLAVRRTLHDYRILFSPEISNRQFRTFAEVASPNTAFSILSRLLSEKKGTKRHTLYIIPENIYPMSY